MYQNKSISVFLAIAKFAYFWWKKCWCQQSSMGVSHDSYIFLIFFRQGLTVPSFIIVGYVWQILGRGPFCSPHLWAALKKRILNRVKITKLLVIFIFLNMAYLLLIKFLQKQVVLISIQLENTIKKLYNAASSIVSIKTALFNTCKDLEFCNVLVQMRLTTSKT